MDRIEIDPHRHRMIVLDDQLDRNELVIDLREGAVELVAGLPDELDDPLHTVVVCQSEETAWRAHRAGVALIVGVDPDEHGHFEGLGVDRIIGELGDITLVERTPVGPRHLLGAWPDETLAPATPAELLLVIDADAPEGEGQSWPLGLRQAFMGALDELPVLAVGRDCLADLEDRIGVRGLACLGSSGLEAGAGAIPRPGSDEVAHRLESLTLRLEHLLDGHRYELRRRAFELELELTDDSRRPSVIAELSAACAGTPLLVSERPGCTSVSPALDWPTVIESNRAGRHPVVVSADPWLFADLDATGVLVTAQQPPEGTGAELWVGPGELGDLVNRLAEHGRHEHHRRL